MSESKLKCMIVDDEPLARDVISNFICRVESLELIASCNSALEAFNTLQKQKVDLIFLDINMPEMKGTEFLEKLSITPKVIFTTAYSEYALQAYNLDVIDYLVKPIEFSRFLSAINKVFNQLNIVSPSISNISEENNDNYLESFIYLKVDKKMQKIFIKDILFIESSKNHIKVKVKNREIIAYKSLTYVYDTLPNKKFIRVHRSFIVSIDYIDSFSPVEIEIKGFKIPVGRQYREVVKNQLGYF